MSHQEETKPAAVVVVAWSKGGTAQLKRLDGERATLSSTIASAPGSRLDGTIDGGHHLRIKVHRCVRRGDGFDVDGRVIDLRRDLRTLLVDRLGGE